ncbi:MAG: hypothetical protein RBT37_01680 [Dissulfurispiraceae bacterium]|jgi:hypothetical protein|nr:hypothetical protein [Dissulfurispiraceae bacterium]
MTRTLSITAIIIAASMLLAPSITFSAKKAVDEKAQQYYSQMSQEELKLFKKCAAKNRAACYKYHETYVKK